MRIFPTIVKRAAAAVASGTANFLASVKPALVVTTVNTGTAAKPVAVPALALDAGRATLLTRQTPAAVLTTVNSGTAKATVVPAPLLRSLYNLAGSSTIKVPAAKVTRIQFDITHRRGGSTVVTSTNWTNPANSMDGTDGRANGTTSGAAGSLGGGTATLILSYPGQANRANLTITQVTLSFYVATSVTVLATTANLAYSLDNGATFTALGSTLLGGLTVGTPQVFNITAAVAGDWSKIAALRTRFIAVFGAASAVESVAADAIEVTVLAAHTMIP